MKTFGIYSVYGVELLVDVWRFERRLVVVVTSLWSQVERYTVFIDLNVAHGTFVGASALDVAERCDGLFVQNRKHELIVNAIVVKSLLTHRDQLLVHQLAYRGRSHFSVERVALNVDIASWTRELDR